MTDTRLQLLGRARLVRDDGRPAPRIGKKAMALLAYLAARAGRAVPREELAELFWPGRFEEQARQSLRQALSAIRRGLGTGAEALRTSDGAVALAAAPAAEGLEVDAVAFERLAASGAPEDRTAAAALYRGAFLGGVGRVSDAFDAWADGERRRLAARAVEVFAAAARDAAARDDAEAALALARRAVEIEPAHEPGHRLVMELAVALGRRAEALRQYEACCLALARELDVAPDAETEALAARIRAAAPAARPAPSSRIARAASSAAAPGRAALSLFRFVRRRRLFLGLIAAVAAAGAYGLIERAIERLPAPSVATAGEGACRIAFRFDAASEPALLVMPFTALEDEAEARAFAAAASDVVAATAALVPGVAIVAGPPPGHPDTGLSPRELAQRNNATHVLSATVRRDRDGAQVTLRLIDGARGRQIWQAIERFPGPDPFNSTAVSAVALRAARGVQERLTDGRQTLAYEGYEPASLAILELDTRGYGFLNAATLIDAERARRAFADALARDPDDVGALAGAGYSHIMPLLLGLSVDAEADLAQARGFAEAALARAPEHPPSVTLAALIALFEGRLDEAVEAGARAARLSGGGADATAFLAYILTYAGDDPAVARDTAARALTLRPYTAPSWYAWVYARALRRAGAADEAEACAPDTDDPAGGLALLAERVRIARALGDDAAARRYAGQIARRAPAPFSSAAFCAAPPSRDPAEPEACVRALAEAGLAP